MQRRKKKCEVHVCGINFQAAVSSIWARNSVNTALKSEVLFKESLLKPKQNLFFYNIFKDPLMFLLKEEINH